MKIPSLILDKHTDQFCLLYKIKLEELKINKTLQFKYLCYRNIKYINKIPIIITDEIKTNQSILVYFKKEPHIEFIIRNMIIQLKDSWDHLVICNNDNYEFIKNIINNISSQIKIQIHEKLIYNGEFWCNLDGYKLLFYDENTIIYKNINLYLNYDYITTIYNEDTTNKNISFRNKAKLLDVNYYTDDDVPEYIYYYKNLVTTSKVADIIETQQFNKIINNKMNIDEQLYALLNKYRKTVYIISGIKGGGTLKFINDLVKNYDEFCEIQIINNKKDLENIFFFDNDVLLVQQLFYTDINTTDLINIKKTFYSKIVINIHDFYWLNNTLHRKINLISPTWHFDYLNKNIINNDTKILFDCADFVIHPSKFTFEEYKKYFNHNNFKLVTHNDFVVNKTLYVPKIKNDTINVGFLVDYQLYKGKEKIDILINQYKNFHNYKINFFIKDHNIKIYNENGFYDFIETHNINCLTLLNKWGETYCYALTLYLNSGLPIIYNNFGAFKERIPLSEHYFKVCENENEFNDNNILFTQFENMLIYIIQNNLNSKNKQKNLLFKTNLFYDYLFDKKHDMTIIHNIIKPFCIYFPQFHKIKENDVNYYENMTDILNLNKYLSETNNEEILLKPNMNNYNCNYITEYNLTNNEIIMKQIEIAKKHGIYGFSIYYYWFSQNEITNNNTIMENCYNNFFSTQLENFKLFFIWANEDWSNNPAFSSKKLIKNEYNEESFIKNIENLMVYFCHENYYKINNCPILYIHHPWFIPDNKLNLFFELLNNDCKKNGFDGVILYVNSSEKKYKQYYNYAVNPNYKIKMESNIIINKRNVIDYEKYLNYINNKSDDDVECLFFSFNNTARLYFPNKLNLRTHTINNNSINQTKFINITFNKLNKNNLLLINSWNEWGEDMAIEENEQNNKLLNMIKFKLLNFIHQDELEIQ